MRDKSPLEFCCLPIRCIENNLLIHCIIVELLFLSWKNVNVPFWVNSKRSWRLFSPGVKLNLPNGVYLLWKKFPNPR